MAVLTRTTFLEVLVGGVPLEGVLSARVSLGFDLATAEATVVLAFEPEGTSYNDVVEVRLGAGDNDVTRFTGLLKQYDRTLWPRSVTLVARGALSRAAEYLNPRETTIVEEARKSAGVDGMLLQQLMGPGPAIDQDIVYAVLQLVPGLASAPLFIDGTGTDLSGVPLDATVWASGETALQYIQRIDAASLGFRTFESMAGAIYRAQITGWPSATPLYTFTEGADIFEGRSTRTILELKNCARVDGYNNGIGAGVISHLAHSSNPIQGDSTVTPHEFQFSTPLALRRLAADTGFGFACEDIANYLLGEWNRELVKVSMTTPLDLIIGPGQTHLVQAIGGIPDRLGVGEPMWVQRVDIEVAEDGAFSQTITYIGGGLEEGVDDGLDSPIDWATQ